MNKALYRLLLLDMEEVSIIFPHQLFTMHPALRASRTVYMVEEFLFFRLYHFHKQKLVMHRASMKQYADDLSTKGFTVIYIDTNHPSNDIRILLRQLSTDAVTHIHYADVADNWLQRRIENTCRSAGIQTVRYDSPNFINRTADWAGFFDEKKTYFQTDFYIAQRKQRKLLLEGADKPVGGKWSFDAANRLRFPKKEPVPLVQGPTNIFVDEARAFVDTYFADNPGTTESPFQDGKGCYPVNAADAEKWLDDFLENRFSKFGVFEDAIVAKEHFLYHSVLTPALNIGLLNPQQIVEKALDAAINYDIPINSLEGFLRQVTGWREFIHIVYEREGSKQRTRNYWGFSRKIPYCFWTANTGIGPVDTVIKKILQSGYSHHIERLMVLGNFMLLCEFDPDDVYRWFMEMYVDSYDWVMVPNVYGMTQFADGGLMTTKPYISGSNYLVKMGDFEKGSWQEIWDGLFWRFMHVHRNFFLHNPRIGMLVATFDKMDPVKQQKHLHNADSFLKTLDEKNETTSKNKE